MSTTATATASTKAKAPAKKKASASKAKSAAKGTSKRISSTPKEPAAAVNWFELLEKAVMEPGELQAALVHFRKYSLANRWLASTQLRAAGVPLQPINTFKGWLGVNRPVIKGQKASVSLNMPVSFTKKEEGAELDPDAKEKGFTMFLLRRNWFYLDQTQGEDFKPEELPLDAWNVANAMTFLEMTEVPFEYNGVSDHRLSYSEGRKLAVSGIAEHGTFQRLREMARIQLGHNDVTRGKNVPTDSHLLEIEVEATAYLCAATVGIAGLEQAQHTLQLSLAEIEAKRIPAACAKRAFAAADHLVNAGYC